MRLNKFKGHRLSKRSEQLMLALTLMGYGNYTSTPKLAKNTYKYYVLSNNNFLTNIFIHKHKAKYHTSLGPAHTRINATKITASSLADIIKVLPLE